MLSRFPLVRDWIPLAFLASLLLLGGLLVSLAGWMATHPVPVAILFGTAALGALGFAAF